MYESKEYIYWQKVNALKEKLDFLNRVPESAIDRGASTLLDLRQSREWATKEERRDLVRMMIQEVGVDMEAKFFLWVKARPDYETLFSVLDSVRLDGKNRYWIEHNEVEGNISDIEADTGEMSTGVEIWLPISHNV